jgi:hypothetical protein
VVTPELDQKIDIVDSETACAYEFKVSGKNAWAEFYKDVVKVLMWNQHREKKLSCLTFIEILLPRNRDDRLLAQPGGATFRSTGTHQIALADSTVTAVNLWRLRSSNLRTREGWIRGGH